jgi:hypothetical protein
MTILSSSIPTESRGVLFHNKLLLWKSIEEGRKNERTWENIAWELREKSRKSETVFGRTACWAVTKVSPEIKTASK